MKSNLYPEISQFIAQSVKIEMEKALSASNLADVRSYKHININ